MARTTRAAIVRALAALTLLGSAASSPASAMNPTPVRIQLVGDSMIQGVGSTSGMGIKPVLSKLMNDAGIPHVYTNSGSAQGGWTVQDISANILNWLNADQPHLVILMIGTNNAAGACATGVNCPGMTNFTAAYQGLVEKILNWSPNVKLAVGTVPYSNKPWSPNQVWINVDIITKGGWNPLGTGRTALAMTNKLHPCMLYDGVHPRDGGWAVMAQLWAEKILPLYGKAAPPINEVLTDKRPYNGERGATVSC